MTILPFIEVNATPIRQVESPRPTRTKSLPPIGETSKNDEKCSSSSKVRSSRPPKIKITSRSDKLLKQLPHAKTAGVISHNYLWKPLTRELPDYDYLWEPLHRDDMRHQYDFYLAPQRMIASLPDEPYRMTTMFETQDRHLHNYDRVRAMQQRQWNREHIQYTIYPYAETVEREQYNKKIRSTLKEQMEEKSQVDKDAFNMKNMESQIVIEQDRQNLENDRQKKIRRAKILFQVTTKNKESMENKWEFDQWNRVHQWHVDRTVLADDPINWSKTMT